MRVRNFVFIPIIAALVLSVSSCRLAASAEHKYHPEKHSKNVSVVIDQNNADTLPKNFRMTGAYTNSPPNVNMAGLADMNMSGSGALSANSLQKIKEKVGDHPIIDVDLREESHLFVNGIGVSWYGNHDDENINLTQSQVISDEQNKLSRIEADKKLKIDSKNKKSNGKLSLIDNIAGVQTEEQLAKSLMIGYVRFAVPDHKRPQDVQVDSFVQFIKSLPNGTWLHFHCRAGEGRTTTFMAMYDMMKNAKNVSFGEIMKRQKFIGGIDLLSGQDASDKSDARERSDFLKNFYQYCCQNQDHFSTTWNQWIQTHKS